MIDLYVVIIAVCEGAGAYGLRVQPMGDGSTGYVQPVWIRSNSRLCVDVYPYLFWLWFVICFDHTLMLDIDTFEL
jgi:hypothetical protein